MSPDVHALTGAYATDALDADERAAFELHLQACTSCRDEVAELQATTERLAKAAWSSPPPELRTRVMAATATTRQVPPLLSARRVSSARTWRASPSMVAAALLLVVASGLGWLALVEHRRALEAERREAQIVAVTTDPDRIERSAAAADGGTATVVMSDRLAVLRVRGLPPLRPGQEYQLWLVKGETPRSVGTYGPQGQFAVLLDDIAGAERLGISVEPRGGSPRPTGPVVLTIPITA